MEVMNFEGMNYYTFLPKNFDEGKKYPVVLFLHGAGTRGNDPSVILNNFFIKTTENYADMEFIRIAPHCPGNQTWFDFGYILKRFVKRIASLPFVDETRFYLTGNSMGGYGTWELAMAIPEYFAGIVPICGGGKAWNAFMLANVPVWAFHGEKDDVVDYIESVRLVDAVVRAGGNARLTSYPDAYHDSWTPTYSNREVFEWLLSLRNDNAKTLVNKYDDTETFG